uniref:Sister chromatid cohesion protein PDS5 homolog A isoform X3 n=1 Tax=Rhizophora mucronata TaxID=61149 RepID=A0A2P2IWG8_RHIMU
MMSLLTTGGIRSTKPVPCDQGKHTLGCRQVSRRLAMQRHFVRIQFLQLDRYSQWREKGDTLVIQHCKEANKFLKRFPTVTYKCEVTVDIPNLHRHATVLSLSAIVEPVDDETGAMVMGV